MEGEHNVQMADLSRLEMLLYGVDKGSRGASWRTDAGVGSSEDGGLRGGGTSQRRRRQELDSRASETLERGIESADGMKRTI